ncbi:hypothetical protein FDH97_gp142 [Erwinia phage vB_EamM_Deimos-Minion]|uniref:Uncharacterized protein n=1 Tax=Erwinia phage vB_EamM_Deimos-Minion TaxID=1815986 RepID=A0A173GF13_9CAUD|nr:hypothetical protein FDH97_gp142 [Erwinia phage vB_EamM_Deimos-Minion]ANH52240.1 hypothetical protein DM_142 [Erwinia phage vB_EamM_Deimos-Minion]
MSNGVMWMMLAACIAIGFKIIGTALSSPASTVADLKRWASIKTPDFIDAAFTGETMYCITERTAKRHLELYGPDGIVGMYSDVFDELRQCTTMDGWLIDGRIVDNKNGAVQIALNMTRNEVVLNKAYVVPYLQILRVTDTFSPEILRRSVRDVQVINANVV